MTDEHWPGRLESDQLVERMRPKLDELKKEHQTARQSLLRSLAVIGVVTLVAAVAVAVAAAITLDAGAAMIGLLPLMISFVVILKVTHGKQNRWRLRVAKLVLPELCKQFEGEVAYQAEADRAFVKPFTKLELAGPWGGGEVQHFMGGKYRGRQFEMVYAHLRAGGGEGGSSTLFQGLLLRIQTQTRFEPGISIRPNFGLSTAFGKRAIPTGNKAFDELFLVSADDNSLTESEQVNQVFTPNWQQALLTINDQLGPMPFTGHSRLSAGLKYDALYMMLSLDEKGRFRTLRHRPFPDAPHLLATEPSLERVLKKLINEAGIVFRVIDQLP